ncbi:MAG: class I SAM-dependent methyltransferase [Planctomycetota bacterium]
MQPTGTSADGAAVYSPLVLRVYDTVVHRFNLPVLWGCASSRVQRMYDELAGPAHLDVGVGTGRYLDRARPRKPFTRLALLDLNADCLLHTARRVARLGPSCHEGDVLRPWPPALVDFDSVGMATLLHCVPGPWAHKAVAFDQARRALRPGGVLFGSTILGRGVPTPWRARPVLAAFNRRGIFHNREDDEDGLRRELEERFDEVHVERVGMVALFRARCTPRLPHPSVT